MGAVLSIARRDFFSYLATPKAAAIFSFFLGFLGLFFFLFVNMFLEYQQQGAMGGQQGPTIDQFSLALFQNIHFILLLVVPGITMGSFSEEKRNHSFKMLQTAPISSLEIVLGKFLGTFSLMMVMVLASFVYPLFLIVYGNPDVGVILTSYLGLVLLIAAQLSFGIWVSSMTTNQFLAFLFSMFGMFALLIMSWAAPKIGSAIGMEGLLGYISISTHFEPLLKGTIAVGDVSYFICFAALFLFFTNAVIDSQRWR